MKDIQHAQKDEHIDQKSRISHKACHAVNRHHEEYYQGNTDGKGYHGLILGVLAQGRTYGSDFQYGNFYRKGAASQKDGQILASSRVRCPVMTAEPPVIASLTTGLVKSSPSR